MKKFLVLSFLVVSLFAISEKNIESEMKDKIGEVTEILKNKATPKEEKAKNLFNKMDDVFDFELMAKISLGNQFSTLNKNDQEQYLKSFTQKLKNSYLDKMDLYTDEKINIIGLEKTQNNRIYLKTIVVGKTQNYEIIYKFYDKNGDWLIYDVDILGVSIVKTYRQQFSEFLAVHTMDELLKNLEQ